MEIDLDQELQLSVWEKEQNDLKSQIIEVDVVPWQVSRKVADYACGPDGGASQKDELLQYVGGVDISFVKSDDKKACVAIVVLKIPSLEVVYSDSQFIHLNIPYVAGYLAFKEAPPVLDVIKKLKQNKPELLPQVIVVDGNGILHHRGCGLACHIGILSGIPCIGVAKNLLNIDGLQRDESYHKKVESLNQKFDSFPLIGASKKVLGTALKTSDECKNPVFVSVGHLISLETAAWVVKQCCKYRVPEPTRQADILSRTYLRERNLL